MIVLDFILGLAVTWLLLVGAVIYVKRELTNPVM